MKHILWIDDEIQILKPLVLLLNNHGYEVSGATSGDEGCELLEKGDFDLVLLDEIMPGKDGIRTLKSIREFNSDIPVVMITKSEDEAMIDKAYTSGVDDFLVKPLIPNQLISTCKRLLERENLIRQEIPEDYTRFYQEIQQKLGQRPNSQEWCSIYVKLTRWGSRIALDQEVWGLHSQLLQECEIEFSRFVGENYVRWTHESSGPKLSVDVIPEFVVPHTFNHKKVYLLTLDCLRLDQWYAIRKFLEPLYKIKEQQYFSILPSATPFARNAMHSGLHPAELAKQYPQFWDPESNRYEKELLELQLRKFNLRGGYLKVRNLGEEMNLRKNLTRFKSEQVVSVVVNFLDYLVHAKRESQVIEELAPDERGLCSLTELWFSRSHVYEWLKEVAEQRIPVILTTDHGSILARKPTIVHGSKKISQNLRYKYGPALRCDPRHALFISNPEDYMLPGTVRYGIAKEDYYFIYPTHPQEYAREYKYTFQHGGISMQELIIPCISLLPKG
jgi:CheY-like chemotaxis protein